MQNTRFDLSGRSAIVTGAAQGIGKAIAKRFLQSGGEVLAQRVDVADYAAVSAAVDELIATRGQIDILCANAGIAGPTHSLWEYPLDDWNAVQSVNVNGVFHCARAVVPHMITRNYGRIVNTASIAGKEGNPNASAYSTSKAAVIGMTKSLGKELAQYDIAVNCITPVTADTRILDQVSEEFIEYMRSKIPRGRFITVDEVAATVCWMAAEDNGFTTAAVYDLSGGRATY